MKRLLLLPLLMVGCGKGEPITMLKYGAGELVKGSGKAIESIGQIPREIGNLALGTSPDTEKDLKSLDKEVRDSLEDLYLLVDTITITLNLDTDNLSKELSKTIAETYNHILQQILIFNQSTNETLDEINNLKAIIEQVENNLNDIELFCESDFVKTKKGKRFKLVSDKKFLTFCEIR